MAPNFPAEIDVFTIPHSRMKELVNKYTDKVQCVDFRDCQEVSKLLKELQTTLYEFKSHEHIENMFIMDQLKNRLKQRHIYNSAVCDCHNDNRLSEMMNLVKHGKHLRKTSIGERINFGEELQKAFSEFVQQFLPHMEEEENIFQPLLVEHFEYDELCVLKEVVLEQHELIKDPLYQEKAELDAPETDEAIKDFRDIDSDIWSLTDMYKEEFFYPFNEDFSNHLHLDEHENLIEDFHHQDSTIIGHHYQSEIDEEILYQQDNTALTDNVSYLPNEILVQIFGYLTPPDRGRCAQVCSSWNEAAYDTSLWKVIYPIQWSRGVWCWKNVNLHYTLEDEYSKSSNMRDKKDRSRHDEDADVDESEELECSESSEESYFLTSLLEHFLPRIGYGIEKIILDGGTSITSRQIRQALIFCPNITHISAAYTMFDYYTLKGLWLHGSLKKLKHLDLQGCELLDDSALMSLAECFLPYTLCNLPFGCNPNKYQKLQINSEKNDFCLCRDGFGLDLNDRNTSCIYKKKFMNCFLCTSNERQHPEIEELYQSSNSRSTEMELCLSELGKNVSLEFLNLSGCYGISDYGLFSLLYDGLLDNLRSLNVSGCFRLSGDVLHDVIMRCSKLKPQNLTYCNNIMNGPYSTEANGCDSISHPIKVCCLTRSNH